MRRVAAGADLFSREAKPSAVLPDAGAESVRARHSRLLARDLVERRLQLLDVASRQFEILGVRAVEFESAEAVHNADRKLPVVFVGQGQNLLDELAHAGDVLVANEPETVALGELADLQATRVLA